MNPPEAGWVTVARLGRTRGNRGELTAVAFSRPERFAELEEVYLFGDGSRVEVEDAWFHDSTLILKFRGIDTISDAERLVGCEVRIPAERRPPPAEGEYYHSDLLDCEVVERATGDALGRVARWDDAGGAGLLELDTGLLIPFARSICVAIEPAAKRIVVDLPEGLKDLNRP